MGYWYFFFFFSFYLLESRHFFFSESKIEILFSKKLKKKKNLFGQKRLRIDKTIEELPNQIQNKSYFLKSFKIDLMFLQINFAWMLCFTGETSFEATTLLYTEQFKKINKKNIKIMCNIIFIIGSSLTYFYCTPIKICQFNNSKCYCIPKFLIAEAIHYHYLLNIQKRAFPQLKQI